MGRKQVWVGDAHPWTKSALSAWAKMAFVLEFLQNTRASATRDADQKDLANWQDFLDRTEKDRARE